MRGSDGTVPPPPVTGVCIVRVQVDGDGLHYRVVRNPDIASMRSERTQECGDVEATLRAVREFLESFGAGVRRPSPPA